jgi:hypothetical protein
MTHSRNPRCDLGLGFPMLRDSCAPLPDPAQSPRQFLHEWNSETLPQRPSRPGWPADSSGRSGGSWRSASNMHGNAGEPMLNTGVVDAGEWRASRGGGGHSIRGPFEMYLVYLDQAQRIVPGKLSVSPAANGPMGRCQVLRRIGQIVRLDPSGTSHHGFVPKRGLIANCIRWVLQQYQAHRYQVRQGQQTHDLDTRTHRFTDSEYEAA